MKLIVVSALCLVWCAAVLALEIPEFTSDVVDETHALDQQQIVALSDQIAQLRASADVHAAIYIVNTTAPLSIEEAANKVFQKWELGRKDLDNGVLLLVALADRRARIEVGYGLEPEFTDAAMLFVQQTALTPAFKRGDYHGGLSATLDSLKQLKLEGRPRVGLSRTQTGLTPSPDRDAAASPVPPVASWARYFGFVGLGLAPLILLFWPAYFYGRLKKRTDFVDYDLVKLGNGFCVFISFFYGVFMTLLPEAIVIIAPLFLLIYTLFGWFSLFRFIPVFLSRNRHRRALARVRWRKIYHRAYGERMIFGRKYNRSEPKDSALASYASGNSSSSSSSSHSSSSSSSSGGGSSGGGGASSSW